MKPLAIILLALALTSCAISRLVPPDQAARIKTVGIVAMSGPVKLEYMGAAALFTDYRLEENKTDDLSVDPFFVDRVTTLLKPYYDVRPLSYDKSVVNPETPFSKVIASVNPQGLDAYIVIAPGNIVESDLYGNLFRKPYLYSGLGLTQFQGVMKPNIFAVRAPYIILVLDGRNGSLIASSAFDAKPQWRTVDKSWWADTFDAMSASQKQQLVDAIKQLIDQSLPTDLRKIRLTP